MKAKRNRATNFLKFGMLLIGILFLLWNCETDDFLLNNKKIIEKSPQKISSKIALQEIQKFQNHNKFVDSKNNTIFNQINSNTFVNKSIVEDLITYTFLLKPTNYSKHSKIKHNDLFFDNLFVNINKQGNLTTHILRYTPTHNWLVSDKNLNVYSGTVAYLSKKRRVISSLTFKEGKVQTTQNKKTTTVISQRGNCTLKFVMRVCGAIEGDSGGCTSFYKLDCGSGGNSGSGFNPEENGWEDGDLNGSGNPIFDNDDNSSGGGGGSTSSGSTGGKEEPFGGSPIIGTCPNGANIDPTTGLCAKVDGPSCKSFNFENVTPTWQESSVIGIRFNIVLIEIINGIRVKKVIPISFSQPTKFGMPRKFRNGTTVPSGLAAEIGARAINHAIEDVISKYNNLTVSSTSVIKSHFQERLKLHFQDYSDGGRVNFNDLSGSTNISYYKTYGILPDNCY